MSDAARLGGRRAEAARNDGRILDAARHTFLADPSAPIADVATRAGVGISALYRRYPSKEALLAELARDGLLRYGADLRTALDSTDDPWGAYAGCLHRVVQGGSQALAQRLAGTFEPTPDLGRLAAEVGDLATRLHVRTQQAGALRQDVTPADVTLLLEMVSFVDLPGPERGAGLRDRYLELILQALRAPAAGDLPGRPPAEEALAARWVRRRSTDRD